MALYALRSGDKERMIVMAIYREVKTEVYCDICGEFVAGWNSSGNGVSRSRTAHLVRKKGCTVGKKIICKKCRISSRIEKCGLQKKYGEADKDGNTCLGFCDIFSDEPIEQCKHCIAQTSFDWDEETEKSGL